MPETGRIPVCRIRGVRRAYDIAAKGYASIVSVARGGSIIACRFAIASATTTTTATTAPYVDMTATITTNILRVSTPKRAVSIRIIQIAHSISFPSCVFEE